jgi:pilus assembly protein CpaB
MNKRLIFVLLFALVVSAAASLILYRLISTQMANNAKPTTVRLLVAAHALDIGALIKDGDVKMADWGGTTVPVGAITKPEDAIGRGIIQPIYEGEPILESRVAAKGAGAGLAATIPQGMRAVAVRVNDIVGVAGFVIPGSHVDLLIAGTPPKGNGGLGTLTKTLMQNVEVLSAGQNIQKDAEGKPVSVGVVNMLVTPSQAEVLALASNETRIQLILRNPLDKDTTTTSGTAIAYLFDGKNGEPPAGGAKPSAESVKGAAPKAVRAKAPPPPPPPPVVAPPAAAPPKEVVPITVEVIHGSSRAQSKFQPDEEKKASEGKKE